MKKRARNFDSRPIAQEKAPEMFQVWGITLRFSIKSRHFYRKVSKVVTKNAQGPKKRFHKKRPRNYDRRPIAQEKDPEMFQVWGITLRFSIKSRQFYRKFSKVVTKNARGPKNRFHEKTCKKL